MIPDKPGAPFPGGDVVFGAGSLPEGAERFSAAGPAKRGRAKSASGNTRQYARKTEITLAMQAAKANGLDIAAIDLKPDGTIRLSRNNAPEENQLSEFDVWDAAGKL